MRNVAGHARSGAVVGRRLLGGAGGRHLRLDLLRPETYLRIEIEFSMAPRPDFGVRFGPQDLNTALFCISFLRKGKVLAYVGRIHNLKDLKDYRKGVSLGHAGRN